MEEKNLLEIQDLVIRFHTDDGVIEAVNGISLSLKAGDTDIQLKTFIHGMGVFKMKIIMRRDSVILSKSRNRLRQRRNLSN